MTPEELFVKLAEARDAVAGGDSVFMAALLDELTKIAEQIAFRKGREQVIKGPGGEVVSASLGGKFGPGQLPPGAGPTKKAPLDMTGQTPEQQAFTEKKMQQGMSLEEAKRLAGGTKGALRGAQIKSQQKLKTAPPKKIGRAHV